MIRSFFISVFSVVAIAALLVFPALSLAGNDKPLMIVRFNADTVAYEQNLGRAVKMALSTKPGVFFDLVAISPETADKSTNKQLSENVKLQAEKITDQISQAGVSAEMVRTSYQTNKFAKSNEVQIFVQ